MWTEKDTLGWMRNAYGVKRGLKKASLYLEGHSICWKGHMCSLYAYTLREHTLLASTTRGEGGCQKLTMVDFCYLLLVKKNT